MTVTNNSFWMREFSLALLSAAVNLLQADAQDDKSALSRPSEASSEQANTNSEQAGVFG